MVTTVAFLGLSACTQGPFGLGGAQNIAADGGADVSGSAVVDPSDAAQTRAALPPPPVPNARTVEQFDTTTDQERSDAVSASSGGAALGKTVASLGSPTDPGIWLKTPLVSTVSQGRIDYNGTSVNVELRPSGGAAGSGSQISLAAIRLIEAPLTSLPEVTVYAN